MEFKIKRWVGSIFLLALIHTAGATLVSATSLSNLVNGGAIQVEDKLFSNFYYNATLDNPGDIFSPINPTGADVNVTGTSVAGNYGLTFTGPFTASGYGPIGFPNAANYVITYDVTVTNPTYAISDIHQSIGGTFSPGAFVEFGASADSIDRLLTYGGPPPIYLSSSNPSESNAGALGSDFNAIHVITDIYTSSGGGNYDVPSFDITFSQSPTGVVSPTPEPSMLLLFGTGLLTVAFLLRNKVT